MKKLMLLTVMCLAIVFANAQTATKTAPAKATTEKKSNKTKVEVKDLLKPITENIAKDYAGYKATEAYKVVDKDVVTYEVVVTKGTAKETLIYDKDGKFLNKVAPKAAPATKKADAPKK